MGTIVIVTYRFEVVVGMHFRNSKSAALFLLEQSQLFKTPQSLLDQLYEQGVSQSEKKRKEKETQMIPFFLLRKVKLAANFPVSTTS